MVRGGSSPLGRTGKAAQAGLLHKGRLLRQPWRLNAEGPGFRERCAAAVGRENSQPGQIAMSGPGKTSWGIEWLRSGATAPGRRLTRADWNRLRMGRLNFVFANTGSDNLAHG